MIKAKLVSELQTILLKTKRIHALFDEARTYDLIREIESALKEVDQIPEEHFHSDQPVNMKNICSEFFDAAMKAHGKVRP